jgi:hypothetical protein
MFGSGVKHGVFGKTNGTRAITHERYMGRVVPGGGQPGRGSRARATRGPWCMYL